MSTADGDIIPAESNDHQSGNSESDQETDIEDRYWPTPTEQTFDLKASDNFKTISAFCFNNAGTRFAAGGFDYDLKIWDFKAIEAGCCSDQSISSSQPCGQTIIKSVDYSNDDEHLLVISGGCQAVILAKDGLMRKDDMCPKGDQYMSDMSKTKGHVQMLNDGCWNPRDKDCFITCSNDSTIRIWNLNDFKSGQKTVIKTRSPGSGLKAVANVCKYSRDSLSIAAGCNDGSISMWDTRRKFMSTSACIKEAHMRGNEVTGVDFSYNGNSLCTRGEDETCKLWDLRQLKKPVSSISGLTTRYSQTNCIFSPDDKMVMTGESCSKNKTGRLLFLDALGDELTEKAHIDMKEDQVSVIRCDWHARINHIAYTCSNGVVHVAFDNQRSLNGLVSKQSTEITVEGQSWQRMKGKFKRQRRFEEDPEVEIERLKHQKIITPHALPLFADAAAKSSFAKMRRDPRQSQRPEIPQQTGGPAANQGGRVAPAGSTLSSYIAKNLAQNKAKDGDAEDIRKRLLRHAEGDSGGG